MKLTLLLLLTLSQAQELPDYSGRAWDEDKSCQKFLYLLRPAHNNAAYWLRKTDALLYNKDIESLKKIDHVKSGFKAYFRLDLDRATDLPYIKKVIQNIHLIQNHADETHYKCHVGDIAVGCVNWRTIGFVPPPIQYVHLCKTYFTYTLDDEFRSIALLHEWGHRWGDSFNYLNEHYCSKSYYSNPETIIREPDQYAYFIYWVSHNGVGRNCFIPNKEEPLVDLSKKK